MVIGNFRITNLDDSIVSLTIAMIAMFHGLQHSGTIESIISGDTYEYNRNVYELLYALAANETLANITSISTYSNIQSPIYPNFSTYTSTTITLHHYAFHQTCM